MTEYNASVTFRSSSGSSSLDTTGYGGGEGQGLERLGVDVLIPDSLVLAPVPVPPSVAAFPFGRLVCLPPGICREKAAYSRPRKITQGERKAKRSKSSMKGSSK